MSRNRVLNLGLISSSHRFDASLTMLGIVGELFFRKTASIHGKREQADELERMNEQCDSKTLRMHRIYKMPPFALHTSPSWLWNHSQRVGMGTGQWSEAIHSDALCCCLNFHGEGVLHLASGQEVTIRPQTLIWCRGVTSAARTHTRDKHECLSLIYPDEWMDECLDEIMPQVPETIRHLVSSALPSGFFLGRSLTAEDFVWSRSLMMSCLSDAARRMLDTARMTDFLLRELFAAPEVDESAELMSRAERIARERVERVKNEVLLHLDENHNLESLASAAGCSPPYLSRTFAQIAGIPLMLWIRRARVERAAELIASGRCNVSEAAFAVGYSSFSHFSRAFHEEKGVSPSKWITHLASTRVP